MDDPLVIAGETFASRLIMGTGGAPSMSAKDAASRVVMMSSLLLKVP